ncbi:MAG: ATP-NAD kinase family protein [Anaerolineales bacterium]
MKKDIALLVNPVAGMGGSVGLKGTDGEMYQKAVDMGAEPVTPDRTQTFLDHLENGEEIHFLTAPGKMGADHLKGTDMPFQVLGKIPEDTSPEDTKRVARLMVERGADLLVFVGGDGTARDIYDAIGTEIPVVAVPAGVKMYSGAFALNPRAAAEMVDAFLHGADVTEEEVLDINEESFREDRLESRLYGYLLVPELRDKIQPGKVASNLNPPSKAVKRAIAAYIVETQMSPNTLYLLGPGTTVRAIAEELEVPKTLLGIDAVYDQDLVGEDINEKQILDLFQTYTERVLIVTPIGGNGFIFGRGNKQFTPAVIKAVGREHIQVVATRRKLADLDCLRVDTGDPEVDQMLSGYLKVIVDYGEGKVMKVEC